MPFRARTTFPHLVSLFLFLSPALQNSVRADDLTGMAQDDAKELLPPAAQTQASPCYTSDFFPCLRGRVAR